jgi:hypothetical protein
LAQAEGSNPTAAQIQAARAGLVGQFVHDLIDFDLTPGAAALNLTAAQYQQAQTRQAAIDDKIAVSLAYLNASQQTGGTILDAHTVGDAAYNAAVAIIQGVTSDPATVTVAITEINTAVANHDLSRFDNSVTFNDDDTIGSDNVGSNANPLQVSGGANGFSIAVSNAMGNGANGVDVAIAPSAFTGTDTINVTADAVGRFAVSGSYIFPVPTLVAPNGGDSYTPNWLGFQSLAYGISAGPSSASGGSVGFQTWDVSSTGAISTGSLNVIALGGEDTSTATTLNVSDDGSNTMLFATFDSGSQLTDWEYLSVINLSATSGFVTLTGAEVSNMEGLTGGSFAGGGLLADNLHGLMEILAGTGNSFYDLTSLTAAAAHAGTFDGGHSTAGSSEVAFNNGVLTSGLSVQITHIQILDDASTSQGGRIDLDNFDGLLPLNQQYAPLAEGSYSSFGSTIDGTVPFGLPYSFVPSFIPTSVSTVPAGFYMLQFLGADGSTATTLDSDLVLSSYAFSNLAINMQDMANVTDSNISISYDGTNLASNLMLFVSDDGVPSSFFGNGTGALNVPVLGIDGYTTVDIVLPYESAGGVQNYVILGSQSLFVRPNTGASNVSVNFLDNQADNGGAPPGGPDDLVLGVTNVIGPVPTQSSFGTPTVIISTVPASSTTINDFGAGSFEIGATNATNLNAQLTSHLVMDLPAVPTGDTGITVYGSLTGQNELQGTSGFITLDSNGHNSGVYEAVSQTLGVGWGNDTLTGGADTLPTAVSNFIGNLGDNFFPEGGTDTVNIGEPSIVQNASTVWVGFYRFLGPAGSIENNGGASWALGGVANQAITDAIISATATGEVFVDGYNSILTINDFNFGNYGPQGDTIVFNPYDWGAESGRGVSILGLVGTDGHSQLNPGGGEFSVTYAQATKAGAALTTLGNVILDYISPYSNAAALQAALLANGVGNIGLTGSGFVPAHSEADILIAYNTDGGGINIADVTLNNLSGTSGRNNTDQFTAEFGASLTVHDLIHINTTGGVGLANLTEHNIFFSGL